MKHILALVAATSIALSMLMASGALADNNFSNVIQSGDDNAGVVAQGPGSGNAVGTQGMAAHQNGNQNVIGFTQSGSDNQIGTAGTGFRQESNRNSATITQTSAGNKVLQVTQTGISSATGGVALRRNTLTIDQGGGSGNVVSRVTQARVGGSNGVAGNMATITQSGAANIIGAASVGADGLTQDGRRHEARLAQTGLGNRVANISQMGTGQSAGVVQTGEANRIERVDQRGTGNRADLSFTGRNNGIGDFNPNTRIDNAWLLVSQGHVYQDGGLLGANLIDFRVAGSINLFGFDQEGSGNQVNAIVIGHGNQTGVAQSGLSNNADLLLHGDANQVFVLQGPGFAVSNSANVQIDGFDNHVGAAQAGNNNDALVTISGATDNTVNINQLSLLLGNDATISIRAGSRNDIAVDQTGNNTADSAIVGSDNFLRAMQAGVGNALYIDIFGNGNNNPALGGFSGDAALTASLVSPSFTPGQIIQSGAANTILYTVRPGLTPSESNRFAFAQNGNGNEIVGETIGSHNQVVVVQSGNANLTAFSQIGNGNVIGVSQ